MRFAIFSDIHGNLSAFEGVLQDIAQRNITQCVCLGDVIGARAPRDCMELVRSLGCPWVQGNHEKDFLDYWDEEPAGSRTSKRRTALTAEQSEYIQSLPFVLQVHNFTIVHSSLHEPEEWNYVQSAEAARKSFAHQQTQLCFHGHTHVPKLFINDSTIREISLKTFLLESDKQYLVNVGSVGFSRDGDDRSAYVIYDEETNVIELIRV